MLASGAGGASVKSRREDLRYAECGICPRENGGKGRTYPEAADGASAAGLPTGRRKRLPRSLLYLSCAQYGQASGRICFGGLGFLNVINSTRPLLISEGRTESVLRRQFMAALRASSSKAG